MTVTIAAELNMLDRCIDEIEAEDVEVLDGGSAASLLDTMDLAGLRELHHEWYWMFKQFNIA